MASLPSVIVGNTLQFESEFKKHAPTFIPLEKRSYCTNYLEKAFDSVIKEGVEFDSSIYVPILQKCVAKNSLPETQMIHAHIVKTGSQENLFLMTFLVNVYGKCRAMESARKVFDKLPVRNVVTWTSLMSGYVHNSQPESAIRVFLEMLKFGAYPTNYTLAIALNACSSLYAIGLAKEIHGYVLKYGTEDDTSVGNALCSLYSKCRNLGSAIKAFRRIREKNVISWTSVISSCGDNGDSAMGLTLFTSMLSEGIEPNEFTLTSVLGICCTLQAMDAGLQVHSLCIKLGLGYNLLVTNSIMYLYLKCGRIDEAKKLFDGMERMRLVTWNAMIAGHAQMMDLAETSHLAFQIGTNALDIFSRLNRSGTTPDLFTISSILTVCSNLAALEQGEQVHALALKTGFLADVVVGTSLVNMYNKCGNIERASKAFVEMSRRTLISWTAMITAFAQHGRPRQALQLFDDMRLAGDRPNKITFVGVLSACSHAGMVDEALAYFDMMKNEYKIKPVMDHYACIIDMFVRLGKLDQAFDFMKKMEFEPSEFIWSILIAGCRSHGNQELAFYAAEQLINLNPKDSETWVFLLNMYLLAGRWKDVSRVRKMMKEKKLGKLNDWSRISIRGTVHSFNPGDRSGEVDNLLQDLLEKAKALGYEPQGSVEVPTEEEAEEKEPALSRVHHSEKLAVAFGLLTLPNGAPIRVIKSISMCRDCHSFIKFISVLAQREIIVRDGKRLHKFINGYCSCGDFGSLL